MIVCRKCSRRHPDGTEFCACGAYLEFDGERVAEATDPARPPLPAPTAAAGPTAPAPTPRQGGVTPAEPAPWSGLPGEPTWGVPPPASTSSVDARLPDVPIRTDTTEPVWVESTGRAGDVPCPACATPNDPARQFCRHCGRALTGGGPTVDATPRAAGRTPWWRRLGKSAKRRAQRADPTSMALTARRYSSGGLAGRTVAFRTGAITVVVFGLLAFLGPWRGTVLAGARRMLGGGDRFEEVAPAEVSAVQLSPSVPPADFPQQPPTNVLDGYANTAWATRWLGVAAPGDFVPPADGACVDGELTETGLRFTFEEETNLAKVAVLGGRHAEDPARGLYSRPAVIELEVAGECDHVVLAAEGELEIHDFSRRNVEVVDLRVVDIAADPEQSPTVEISEVVFGER